MKKNYISPDSKEMNMEGCYLLTSSSPDVTVDDSGAPIDAGSVGARRHNVWDEDEEYY